MIECHVITLDRTIDNFYKQRPYLIESGIFPKRFRGVDSKLGEHVGYSDHLTQNCKDFCPTGVIGCGLSHILLAKQLYEGGSQLVLVLEDDAYPLVADLNKEIQKIISETPSDWDIIKLHCDFCQNDSNEINNNINEGSAAAYLVNKSGLEKLSNMKLNFHIDLQWNMDKTLNIYKSKQNIFWADEKQSENRDSTSTFLGKFNFNKTGQKTIDNVLSYKVLKIFGYDISGWDILIWGIIIFIIIVSF